MSQQINDEISMILNGKTSSILDKLETLQKEMQLEMNNKFELAFKKHKKDYSLCNLYGVDTANSKLIMKYLTDFDKTSIVNLVTETGMNRVTVDNNMRKLMKLGYVVKNGVEYEINQTKIY